MEEDLYWLRVPTIG